MVIDCLASQVGCTGTYSIIFILFIYLLLLVRDLETKQTGEKTRLLGYVF